MDLTNSTFYRYQQGAENASQPDEPIPGATYRNSEHERVAIQLGASTQAVLQANLDSIINQRDQAVEMANSLLDRRTGKPREGTESQHARLVTKVNGLTASAEYQCQVGERQLAAEAEDDGGASALIAQLSAQHEAQQRAQREKANNEIAARAGRTIK